MATETMYFTGDCRWAQLMTPDQMYNQWKIAVAMDDESRARFNTSGLQMQPKLADTVRNMLTSADQRRRLSHQEAIDQVRLSSYHLPPLQMQMVTLLPN